MRINVYAEELTSECEVVTKTVVPDGRTDAVTFYGIRFYLISPDALHSSADDDDRSAITLWAKWTHKGGNDFETLSSLFTGLVLTTQEAFDHDARLRRGM